MNKSLSVLLIVVVVLLAVGGGIVIARARDARSGDAPLATPPQLEPVIPATETITVAAGPVPATPTPTSRTIVEPDLAANASGAVIAPAVATAGSPAPTVNRAVEAIEANPERFSTLTAPKTFDLLSYQADSAGYCAQVVPGRIWQVAQPGRDVPQLSVVGSASSETKPGGTVILAVKAAPGAPVTLHSADLGGFSNQQTTITVRADDQGIASTPWVATPGTTGSCHILAACPLTSGQVELFIFVQD